MGQEEGEPPSSPLANGEKTAAPAQAEGKPEEPAVSYFKLYSTADKIDWLLIAIGLVGAMGGGVMLPLFTIVFGDFVDAFGDPNSVTDFTATVSDIALKFTYIAIAAFVAMYLEVSCFVLAGERQTMRLRQRYLESVLAQDIAYFDTQATTGALLQGLNDDGITVQTAISDRAAQFVHHMTCLIAGFIIAFAYGWDITLVMLGCMPILGAMGAAVFQLTASGQAAANKAYYKASGIAQQSISSVRTVAAYNGADAALSAYEKALRAPLKAGFKTSTLVGFSLGGMQATMYCAYAASMFYGAYRIAAGKYTGGEVILAQLSALMASFALAQAAPVLPQFAAGRSAGYRMFQVIERQPKMQDVGRQALNHGTRAPSKVAVAVDGKPHATAGSSSSSGSDHHASAMGVDVDGKLVGGASQPLAVVGELPHVEGHVELRDVHFAYPARPDVMVFRGFNLVVPAGHTVALVGASGSGKSTAVQLLERFYDPDSGSVLLDGMDLRSLGLKWLRKQIGLVAQEPTLFATTIYENIAIGRPGASKEEVVAAAKAANAHKFIRLLPETYGTQVGERGVQLSGGQKQRIAIARAILKQPKVLLLDEATSALDTQSERVVQAALDRMVVGRTTVVVAHRLSTIQHAHAIAVVSAGQVVELGRHDELLARKDGAYAVLVQMQLQAQKAQQLEARERQASGSGAAPGAGAGPGESALVVVEAEEGVEEPEEDEEEDGAEGAGKLPPSAGVFVTAGADDGTAIKVTPDSGLPPRPPTKVSPFAAGMPSNVPMTAVPAAAAAAAARTVSGAAAAAKSGAAANAHSIEGAAAQDQSFARGSSGAGTAGVQVSVRASGAGLDQLEAAAWAGSLPLATDKTHANSKAGPVAGKREQAPVSKKKELSAAEQEKLDEEAAKAVPFKRLLELNKPEWPTLICGFVSSAAAGLQHPFNAFVWTDMLVAFFLTDTDELKRKASFNSWMFFVIAVGTLFSVATQQTCLGWAGQKLALRLRVKLLGSLLRQEIAFFDDDTHSSGRLTSALATDAAYIRGAVGDALGMALQNLSTVVVAYIIALIYDYQMALVVTGAFPLLILAMIFQMQFAMGASTKRDSLYQGANQYISEAFSSIRIIQSFNLQGYITGRYQALLDSTRPVLTRQAHIGGISMGFSFGIIFCLYGLIIWFGGWQVEHDKTDFNGMLKGFLTILMAAMGMGQATLAFPDIGKAKGAVGRVFPLIDRVPAIDPDAPGDTKPDSQVKGEISFVDIQFAYPARPSVIIYNNFSLTIPAGKVYAMVGESGSGKSTVVALLERFYDPVSGSILLDGVDIKHYNLKWLRQQIGLVSQEPILFAGTVADNIRYGAPEASMELLEAAARTANAHEFIMALPEGYNTVVGEGGGIQLSGGQKQRIAIARAVVKNPKVLLLDEATSALDARSERVVQDALDGVMHGRTCLVIAHRLSTIKNAAAINVLYKGAVLEQGTHDELMAKPGSTYAKLVKAQETAHKATA